MKEQQPEAAAEPPTEVSPVEATFAAADPASCDIAPQDVRRIILALASEPASKQ